MSASINTVSLPKGADDCEDDTAEEVNGLENLSSVGISWSFRKSQEIHSVHEVHALIIIIIKLQANEISA